MNEIEQNRRIQEEQKLASKEARMKAASEEDIDDDDRSEAEMVERDNDDMEDDVPEPNSQDEEPIELPYAPQFRRSLQDLIENPETVKTLVCVVDARDPSSFRSTWLENVLKEKKSSLRLVYALSKSDLVPAEVLTGWVYHFMQRGYAAFPVSVLPEAVKDHPGVDAFASHIGLKQKKGDIVVAGFENVGKTSVATALQGAFQAMHKDLQVFDSPMLMSPLDSVPRSGIDKDDDEDEDDEEDESEQMATEQERCERTAAKNMWMLMRNKGQVQRFKDPIALVKTLLPRVAHPFDLMLVYGTPAFGSFVPGNASLADDAPLEDVVREQRRQSDEKALADTEEFLIGVARSVGRLKRHGIPDILSAARIVLRDWSHAALGYYAVPAERAKGVLSHGSEDAKHQWHTAAGLVERMKIVAPRKEWRKTWKSRELRLLPMPCAPYGSSMLVFGPILEDEDESDQNEDVPVYEDDEDGDKASDGDDYDDEMMKDLAEDEDIDDDDDGDDEDDDYEEEEEEEEEEVEDETRLEDDELSQGPPTKQRLAKVQKSDKPRATTISKRSSKTPSKPKAAPKPKKSVPKPGEAYDINAYF